MTSAQKKHIRQLLRQQRHQLSFQEKTIAAEKIMQQLLALPEFQSCHHLACYVAHDNEVDLHAMIHTVTTEEKRYYYLPVLDLHNPHRLEFYTYQSGDTLITNRYGIPEPDITHQQRIAPQELAIVLVPLVAFDEYGHRIGRGAGYYDRTFAFLLETPRRTRPLLIGLAYDFQQVEPIEPDSWDITLNKIITEKRTYHIL
ncbi:MAG: 5-formyltetrahydrofolate cyclo-ligase [Coxiella sp. RIFCSPHIGHO2_12_FULL_44_14]|nr:MAG: 5-formyltetrahydrofolate cyclo-ligase [Coxiella sp. RIFCSPHIGHO2_12_FULL_44_14]